MTLRSGDKITPVSNNKLEYGAWILQNEYRESLDAVWPIADLLTLLEPIAEKFERVLLDYRAEAWIEGILRITGTDVPEISVDRFTLKRIESLGLDLSFDLILLP